MMRLQFYTSIVSLFVCLLMLKGVQGLTLSSTVAPDGRHITACPHTNITLTCTATQVTALRWIAVPGIPDNSIQFVPDDIDGVSRVTQGAFTLTLVEVANRMGNRADLTSTMDVMVDVIQNGTNVSCHIFMNENSVLISKESPPSPPSNLMTVNNNFQTEKFSILLSWEGQETGSGAVDTYIISINTTTQPIHTNITSIVVEAEYNKPMHISVSAVNCAGTSGEVIKEIFEAGCSPPQAPVNGSVSGFTSSRVGAQVTYHCDTGLVLMGETVASCSSPSLRWLPSASGVMCILTTEECGDLGELLQMNVSIRATVNGSTITFYCDSGFILHGSSTSQCVSGEWTPSPEDVLCIPEDVLCIPEQDNVTSTPSVSTTADDSSGASSSLSTADTVAISAVVAGLCTFTAGLLLGVLLTRCVVHCRRKQKRGQTERPPVYEDIQPDERAGIELKHNEAYGHISHNY